MAFDATFVIGWVDDLKKEIGLSVIADVVDASAAWAVSYEFPAGYRLTGVKQLWGNLQGFTTVATPTIALATQ